ncbi:hypothetical protein [Paracoccus marinaquae]|uniref:Transposase n=1 Tax=Paracoccus marinaquae TaxID=2841926 RepID=A0ABS6AKC5_9RHOB|nr:hypothetical protein [Paracoccus marinaquae]MBU3031034.1 hypothetical protein [Paracoccus marinaquae]
MSKHISDQPRSHGAARLREFTKKERETGLHPAVAALRSRPKTRDGDGRKTAEYVRIERGHLT